MKEPIQLDTFHHRGTDYEAILEGVYDMNRVYGVIGRMLHERFEFLKMEMEQLSRQTLIRARV